MLSNHECHVLQMRPGQVICHACLANIASALSGQPDTMPTTSQGSYQHGAGKCSVCAQFSPIVVFIPLEDIKKKAAKNR
jgi:hypothetical protein